MMKMISLFLLVIGILPAQNPVTPSYPSTVATDEQLLVAKRLSESTLSTTINSSTTTVVVSDGTMFLNYELIRIDNEEMLICSISTNTLTICTGARGINGTTAAAHTAGASVRGVISSLHHNRLAAELKALLIDQTPILFSAFPSTCVANKSVRRRSDPATPGQDRYVCNGSGNGWVLSSGSSAASAISFTPYSTLSGTNVQTVIQELLDELPASGAYRTKEIVSGTTYTVDSGDCVKFLTFTAASNTTVTLPDPSAFPNGCWIIVKNSNPNAINVTLDPVGGIQLDGNASNTRTLTFTNPEAILITDAVGWFFVGGAYLQGSSMLSTGYAPSSGIVTLSPDATTTFYTRTNASSGGTTSATLTKLNASGDAVKAATTDTGGIIGVAVGGAGTTGSVDIIALGFTNLTSEGNTTIGHYIGISSTTAGYGTSSSTCPTGQVIGLWLATGTGSASRSALIMPGLCQGAGSGSGYSSIKVDGGTAETARAIINFLTGNGVNIVCDDNAGAGSTDCEFSIDDAVTALRSTVQANTDNKCNPTSSSGTAITCNLATALSTPVAGMKMTLTPDVAFTGNTSTTIAIGGGTARRVYRANGSTNPLVGDGVVGRPTELSFDANLDSPTGAWVITGATSITTATIASGSSALGTSAIASGACASAVTVSAPGVLTTDIVPFTPNADITAVTGYAPVTTGGLAVYSYPTANNVNFKVCNPTSSSITPGAVTLNWKVVR